tara:strand:+ start:451 stop:585 length:135 start_codon:yes stop_codon:yes gene_type:complete
MFSKENSLIGISLINFPKQKAGQRFLVSEKRIKSYEKKFLKAFV